MKITERILNILAPHNCLVCYKEGSLLCNSCQIDACSPLPSRCYCCKKLTNDFAVCSSCRKRSKLNNVWIRTEYNGIAKQLVYKLKFQSSRDAADVIASLLSESIPILSENIEVVGIPTATKRRRQRGYDHAMRIAKRLSLILSLHHSQPLSRVGQTRQVGASRTVRQTQLTHAFTVNENLIGRSFLLVDDVTTTGATLELAAKELKLAGAKKVYAAVFAQK